jgi:hypothetical protein
VPTPLKITLTLILGIVIGGVVNMGLIVLGPMLIPPPPGADLTSS